MTTTTKIPAKARLIQAQLAARNPQHLMELTGWHTDQWVGRCHEISLALLKTGEFGSGRIARGTAEGVPSQHSWIVLGDDVYDPKAVVVDATHPVFHELYDVAHRDPRSTGTGTPVLVTANAIGKTHFPHGMGSILAGPPPFSEGGVAVFLTPSVPLSGVAKSFLAMLGPLDARGWARLASGPMEGWPAAEIVAAMDDTKALRALVPIDILGMLTDRNPGGLYLAGDAGKETTT